MISFQYAFPKKPISFLDKEFCCDLIGIKHKDSTINNSHGNKSASQTLGEISLPNEQCNFQNKVAKYKKKNNKIGPLWLSLY